MSKSGTEGVIALVDQETGWATGDPGPWYVTTSNDINKPYITIEGTTYPDNGRQVYGGGDLVSVPRDQAQGTTPPLISILAHELGHTLWFPHSFRFDPFKYDNPMDIMSDAEAAPGLQVGTIALNRYAAGWIDPEDVEIYRGTGISRYLLAPPGQTGTQMLVLQSADGGFITLAARVRKSHDSGLPKEGVESYFVDTATSNCGGDRLPPCFGLERPTQALVVKPTVPLDFTDGVGHVMGVGDAYIFGEISVRVVERQGDRFIVEVNDELSALKTAQGLGPPPVNLQPLDGFYNEAYDKDPLNLIAGYDTATYYSLGNDQWEVWICRTPDGYLDINPREAVSWLETRIVPYFGRLSGNRYRPVFSIGGSVEVSIYEDLEYGNCGTIVGDKIRERDTDFPEGVLLIADKVTYEYFGSLGDNDLTQQSVLRTYATTYPESNREIYLGGQLFVGPEAVDLTRVSEYDKTLLTDDESRSLTVIAHELGHALGFPHSLLYSEYNNSMDIVSRVEDRTVLGVGTIAINRYAAGWIDTSGVKIYEGQGIQSYRLRPPGDGGTQMLAIRSDGSGYLTLGARVRKDIDLSIPKEGVEVYLVDEQSSECSHFWSCVWTGRNTRAVVSPTTTGMSTRRTSKPSPGWGYR